MDFVFIRATIIPAALRRNRALAKERACKKKTPVGGGSDGRIGKKGAFGRKGSTLRLVLGGNCLTSDIFDVAPGNAEIVQFAIRKLVEFTHRSAVTAPGFSNLWAKRSG